MKPASRSKGKAAGKGGRPRSDSGVEKTVAEIARELGQTEDQIRYLLKKAIKKLEKVLREN